MKIALRYSSLSRLFPLLNGALILLAGFVAAYWTWAVWDTYRMTFETKNSVLTSSEKPFTGVSPIVAAKLFGQVGQGNIESAGRLGQRLKLFGTFSGWHDKPEYALIAVDGARPAPFAKGAELLKGVVLREVAPEHVLLARDGGAERLELSSRKEGASPLNRGPISAQGISVVRH